MLHVKELLSWLRKWLVDCTTSLLKETLQPSNLSSALGTTR